MTKPAVHFDLVVGNKHSEKTFYNQVFEWTFEESNNSAFPEYEHISGLNSPSGGINLPKEAPSKLILFIEVDNIDETRGKIQNEGCNITGDIDHPKGGKYALFHDPEGILMGIYQSTA